MIAENYDKLRLPLTKYIPHSPTPKQRAFLMLPHREAFYGGAAGGGKSDALLMGALQHVHVPNYSAIIFRRTFADLKHAGSLISRSHEWLGGSDAKWSGDTHSWRFPSGATVAFGYLDRSLDKFQHRSAEYQYVAFDELTDFREGDYLFLYSRLRRLVDSNLPLRVRSASNPGGPGHTWVRRRFDIGPVVVGGTKRFVGRDPRRPYIPALVDDNPFLDREEYIKSLHYLHEVEREQYLAGDWAISAQGRFRKDWAKYYSVSEDGSWYFLGPGRQGATLRPAELEVFQVCDPAASAKDLVPSARSQSSWTVIATFARIVAPHMTSNLKAYQNHLLLLDVRRFQKETPEIIQELIQANKDFRPAFIGIENVGVGLGVCQWATRVGLPVRGLGTKSQDKVVRATDIANRMEQGQVWFPERAPWLEEFEAELYTWTGDKSELDDQIDVMAHAGRYISEHAGYEHRATQAGLLPMSLGGIRS